MEQRPTAVGRRAPDAAASPRAVGLLGQPPHPPTGDRPRETEELTDEHPTQTVRWTGEPAERRPGRHRGDGDRGVGRERGGAVELRGRARGIPTGEDVLDAGLSTRTRRVLHLARAVGRVSHVGQATDGSERPTRHPRRPR